MMACKELHRDLKVETFMKLEKPSKVSSNLTNPSSLNASKIELNTTTPAISIHNNTFTHTRPSLGQREIGLHAKVAPYLTR